ncbi:MAG: dTMP kinase [Candidatus Omnitrophica bacterium]|nr:dTMP kinase [Candidatus Omnitrophota bacterium]
MRNTKKGLFITFEGSEGSGKSTQMELIGRYLKEKNKDILFVREPGGVAISEKIRAILLDPENKIMASSCEMLLYMAARAQLVEEIIAPALKKGKVVICDRFLDSTIVYQGYGHQMDIPFINKVGTFATQGIKPDLTFIFDIEAKKGLARIKRDKDRIEQRAMTYHTRVRNGYLAIAKKEPKRIKIINSDQSIEDIHKHVRQHIDRLLG